MGELLLEHLALGDVAGVEDDPSDVGIVQQVRAEGLDVNPRSVSVPNAKLDQARGSIPVPGQERHDARCLVGVDQIREARTQDLLWPIAEDALDGWAHVSDGGV